MKKLIATIAAISIALGTIYAQDLAKVTEIYNNGATALSSGDKAGALKSFEQALSLATALGDEGKEVVANCENAIPSINLSMAKDLIKSADYDGAITKLNSTIEIAKKYNAEDVSVEASSLIPQVLLSKGDALRTNKQYAEAAAVYKQILASDPNNGSVALRLGICLAGAGDMDNAKAAYETAAANGQQEIANKQLANICLREASNALKNKNYSAAVAAALKVNEYGENPQAYQIAGQASQLAGKNNDAIGFFEKYLQIAPKSSNAGQIAYTVGVLYQQAKNNDKAKEFYTKALSDPKFGASAKKLIDALK